MVRTGKVPFEELCDDDKIAAFFKWLMGEWSQEMEEMPETERRTAKGKAAVLTCKQCARYLKRPGFSKEEPESLYRRDSPCISSYYIQSSFQIVNQFILT